MTIMARVRNILIMYITKYRSSNSITISEFSSGFSGNCNFSCFFSTSSSLLNSKVLIGLSVTRFITQYLRYFALGIGSGSEQLQIGRIGAEISQTWSARAPGFQEPGFKAGFYFGYRDRPGSSRESQRLVWVTSVFLSQLSWAVSTGLLIELRCVM